MEKTLKSRLERYFHFAELGTNWRTEILAGITTFVTMAYIIFVNPSILAESGMPVAAVTGATCLCAAFGSLCMGAFARYPIALAPGMGLNAYFTYVVVKGMGIPWQTALGAVFLSGVIFLFLTAMGIRKMIVTAIPPELYSAVAAGIGLFIGLVGFKNAGIIVANPTTLVAMGSIRKPETALALATLIFIAALLAWGVRAAILIGVLVSTVAGALLGLIHWHPQTFSPAALAATAFKLDIAGALHIGLAEIVFVFLFVDLFDNVGTLVAVGKKAGLFDAAHEIPRVNRILLSDATATVIGSLAGTSTVVSYIESASGVVAGGRSGITAVTTGVLFLIALPIAPFFGALPAAATSPALIIVGSMMLSQAAEIRWSDPSIALPAFLTIVTIPLTFSIANGLGFGFTAFVLLKMARGDFRAIHPLLYILAAIFLLRFFYLSGA